MKGLSIVYESKKGLAEYIYILESQVDPIHNDITVNGFGINLREAKKIRDWFDKAINEIKTNRKKK
jgi:ABC-type amino acid transport substrate-binding protein